MSVNKVILVGNVGKDPEVRYLDKDVAVANFPLATSERATTLQNGTQIPERTEWHNIVAWRGLATIAEKYIKKGSQIYVEGKLQTRTYEKDGIKRYYTEIYAETIQLLGKKLESGEAQATQPTEMPATPPASDDDLPF
jgi:single-strand DNA-binding protein